MCEDSPEDLVMARLSEGVWRDSVLGREILGKAETVKRITAESMREYQQTNYVGANIVISASGHLDEQAFLADCERLFGQVAKGVAVEDSENGAYACVCALTEKDIEQNHLCIGFPSYPMFDERRYAVSVLSALTGGTMSSRLFRSIREQEGLAYNISSYLSPYLHTGLFCIYTALAPSSESKCLTRIRQELDDIRQNGFTDAEVARAKEQLASGMILDLESSSAHMKMRAKREIYGMGETDADEILRRIDGVTAEQVRDVAQEILDYANMSISVVGHTQDEDFYRSFFS
jgi:predicted Zn-dependent peptidase